MLNLTPWCCFLEVSWPAFLGCGCSSLSSCSCFFWYSLALSETLIFSSHHGGWFDVDVWYGWKMVFETVLAVLCWLDEIDAVWSMERDKYAGWGEMKWTGLPGCSMRRFIPIQVELPAWVLLSLFVYSSSCDQHGTYSLWSSCLLVKCRPNIWFLPSDPNLNLCPSANDAKTEAQTD